jgi:hypothetical protein
MSLQSLKERASQLSATLPIMEGREKGEMDSILNTVVTITDYDFLQGDDSPFAVFTIEQIPYMFFFGGGVITDHIQTLDKEGYKAEIQKEGLPVRFEKKKSKNGRMYVNAILFPEA